MDGISRAQRFHTGRMPHRRAAKDLVFASISRELDRAISYSIMAELADARHRLELLDDGDSRAVHAAFDRSYRSLSVEQQRLFRLLSLHPSDEIALEGAAALANLPKPRTRTVLRELTVVRRPGW